MDEDEILELILSFLPETVEGWLGLVFLACAVAALVVPAPDENSHPCWKVGHRVIRILGLGAGRLKTAGKIGKLGKLSGIFWRRK